MTTYTTITDLIQREVRPAILTDDTLTPDQVDAIELGGRKLHSDRGEREHRPRAEPAQCSGLAERSHNLARRDSASRERKHQHARHPRDDPDPREQG